MRVYFASDFHLKFIENQEDKERREKVISFLDSLVGNADLLVLNGDVFDLWFTWNTVMIKGYFPILKKLADISESGCRIVFTAGNHDFWFRDFLTDYLDIELFEDSFSEVIDGKSVYVTHGDLYTKNDFRYKLFRSLVRNKSKALTIPRIYIGDEDVIKSLKLDRVYKNLFNPKDLDELFKKPVEDLTNIIDKADRNMKSVLRDIALAKIQNKQLNNYSAIKILSEKLNFHLQDEF